MDTVYALVDHANVSRRFQKGTSHEHILGRLVRQVYRAIQELGWPVGRLLVRLYDGWGLNGAPTRAFSQVSAALAKLRPGFACSHIEVELAQSALANNIIRPDTLRSAPLGGRTCTYETSPPCSTKDCSIRTIAGVLATGVCDASHCKERTDHHLRVRKQGPVDHLISIDLLGLALEFVPGADAARTCGIAVISDDSDLAPSVALAESTQPEALDRRSPATTADGYLLSLHVISHPNRRLS